MLDIQNANFPYSSSFTVPKEEVFFLGVVFSSFSAKYERGYGGKQKLPEKEHEVPCSHAVKALNVLDHAAVFCASPPAIS